jgi:hypothetical protein
VTLAGYGPVTVIVTGNRAASSDYGVWVWSNGVLVYEDHPGGAATWSATETTVTGQVGASILWSAYCISPMFIPPATAPDPGVNGLRLTLTTAVPVTTTDVVGASTVFFTPHMSGAVALYTGTAWVMRTTAEVSIALSGLTSARNYDVFAYWTGSAVALELSAVWTNDTTRADAIVRQNGVWVKSGATTRRLVGTFRTTGTTTTEDSLLKRFLWNGPERWRQERRIMRAVEATNSWNYTTATFRQANAAAANQVEYVTGMPAEEVEADVMALVGNSSANVTAVAGIGVDSTSVNSAQRFGHVVQVAASAQMLQVAATYNGFPGLGYHALVWLEYSQASGTSTWYGDNGTPTTNQSGMRARAWA